MSELKWYFPETLEESQFLKTKNKSAFHSGGTGLRRTGLDKFNLIIDTSKLPIKDFDISNEIKIGAGLTFSETINLLKKNGIKSILSTSLENAANTPLRNRITIGGSLGALHIWSDLIGPLMVLNSKVILYKGQFEKVDIESFLFKKEIRENAIITGIEFPNNENKYFYYRESRTKVDYPAFTLSIIKDKDNFRIAVTGSKKRFLRLEKLEEKLNSNSFNETFLDSLDVDFTDKPHGSSKYLLQCLKVAIVRGLRSVGYDW